MNQAIMDRVGKRPDWFSGADCYGMTARFYPRYNEVFDERDAKSVCARCPVMLECFYHRLATRELGVWGHVNEDELHKFSGDYNQTVLARMTGDELRAYIVRVAAPRKPRQRGRAPGSEKKEKDHGSGSAHHLDGADERAVPGDLGPGGAAPRLAVV